MNAGNANRVFTMLPIKSKKHAYAPDLPFDMWLPYEQRLSERYVCEENGTIFERFREIGVISENEEYPEGDLETEVLKLDAGIVAWSSDANIGLGARIIVRGHDGSVIFEETIDDEHTLGRLSYFTARQAAPMLADSVTKLEQDIRFARGFWCNYNDLLSDMAGNETVLHVDVRGTLYDVAIAPVEIIKPFDTYVTVRGGTEDVTFAPGDIVTRVTTRLQGESIESRLLDMRPDDAEKVLSRHARYD